MNVANTHNDFKHHAANPCSVWGVSSLWFRVLHILCEGGLRARHQEMLHALKYIHACQLPSSFTDLKSTAHGALASGCAEVP